MFLAARLWRGFCTLAQRKRCQTTKPPWVLWTWLIAGKWMWLLQSWQIYWQVARIAFCAANAWVAFPTEFLSLKVSNAKPVPMHPLGPLDSLGLSNCHQKYSGWGFWEQHLRYDQWWELSNHSGACCAQGESCCSRGVFPLFGLFLKAEKRPPNSTPYFVNACLVANNTVTPRFKTSRAVQVNRYQFGLININYD